MDSLEKTGGIQSQRLDRAPSRKAGTTTAPPVDGADPGANVTRYPSDAVDLISDSQTRNHMIASRVRIAMVRAYTYERTHGFLRRVLQKLHAKPERKVVVHICSNVPYTQEYIDRKGKELRLRESLCTLKVAEGADVGDMDRSIQAVHLGTAFDLLAARNEEDKVVDDRTITVGNRQIPLWDVVRTMIRRKRRRPQAPLATILTVRCAKLRSSRRRFARCCNAHQGRWQWHRRSRLRGGAEPGVALEMDEQQEATGPDENTQQKADLQQVPGRTSWWRRYCR